MSTVPIDPVAISIVMDRRRKALGWPKGSQRSLLKRSICSALANGHQKIVACANNMFIGVSDMRLCRYGTLAT